MMNSSRRLPALIVHCTHTNSLQHATNKSCAVTHAALRALACAATLIVAASAAAAGSLTIYLADQDTDGVYELYGVDPITSTTGKINPTPVAGGEAYGGLVLPKGVGVIYEGDIEVNDQFRLWRSSPPGAAPTPLTQPFVASSTYGFAIDSKGANLVYLAEQETALVPELYRIDLKTGGRTKLNPPLPTNGRVSGFKMDPKGRFVIYKANQDSADMDELYYTDLKTNANHKVSGPMATDGNVTDFKIDAKGSMVVYIADADNALYELHRADLKTGNVMKISGPLQANGEVWQFQIDPKSASVAYLADQDTDGVDEVYRVVLKTGLVNKVNPTLVSGGNVSRDLGIKFDPKGKFLLYVADQEVDYYFNLYKADLKSGAVNKINLPFVDAAPTATQPKAAISRAVSDFEIHPKSSSIVYLSDVDVDNSKELYKLDMKSGQTVQISPEGGDPTIMRFRYEPSGAALLFIGKGNGARELFRYDLKTNIRTTLNPPLVTGGDVYSFNMQGNLNAYNN